MFSSVGISQWIVVYPAGFSATMMFFTVPVSRYTVKLLFADLDIELIGFVAAHHHPRDGNGQPAMSVFPERSNIQANAKFTLSFDQQVIISLFSSFRFILLKTPFMRFIDAAELMPHAPAL
jgi:hypothetical protein